MKNTACSLQHKIKVINSPSLMLLGAFLINLAIAVVFILCTEMYYETTDDYIVSTMISSGEKGYVIPFLNWLLCAFCGLVQNLIPVFNSFVFVQMVFSLLAFTLISYILSSRFKSLAAKTIALLVPATYAFHHYTAVQFTKTSALLLITGVLAACYYTVFSSKKRYLLAGAVFVMLGGMYRIDNALVFLAFYFVLLVCLFFYNNFHKKFFKGIKVFFKEYSKKIIKISVSCVVILAAVFLPYCISLAIHNGTPENRHYSEYNAAQVGVVDYGVPDYNLNRSEYDKLEINENDTKMLREWYVDEKTITPAETLKAIAALRKEDKKDYISIAKKMFKDRYISVRTFTREGILIILYIILMCALLLFCRKRILWVLLPCSAFALMYYGYLYYLNRMPFRVVYGIWLFMTVFFIFSIDRSLIRPRMLKLLTKFKNSFSILLLLFCIGFSVFSVIYCNAQHKNELSQAKDEYAYSTALFDYITDNGNKYFVLDTRTNYPFVLGTEQFDMPLNAIPEGYLTNVTGFGRWAYNSPYELERLKKIGTDNLYSFVINNPDAIVVDITDIDIKERYFNDHYAAPGEKIEYKQIGQIDKFKLYSVIKTVDEG